MFRFNNQFRPYTPDTISRNIKRVREGVIEIRRYSDAKLRQFLWMWFLVITFFWIWNAIDPEQPLHHKMEWAWNSENNIKYFVELMRDPHRPDYTIDGEKIELYTQERILRAREGMIHAWVLLSVPLWFLLLLVTPDWRPLRIDTNRRIAYFWLFGKFYITRYDERTNPIQTFQPYSYQSRLTLPEHAALVLTIPHETDPDDKVRVDLGIYRPACDFQDQVLREFLTDYMQSPNPDEEFARYFKKEKRLWSDYINFFYHFSLFPTRGYNEKKTEAKIQQWLENNPEIY
ncbi:hypothetical protein PHA51_11220 [Rodentibacter pneumotropicus]|uniref:hypothetical protein n=1 Tax=Rodentibacter pneumotropicus TaxID=758 RepID=UPI00232EB781|nr:hypothetical protein [Rodentibacter pneumotropicus]MDC2826586.1 hypothetical protein [Rodentibacter pneumotropicus]